MQKLIILAAIAACCLAAPTHTTDDIKEHGINLQRPTPINPDVLSDPKPTEKLTTLIEPKHKRDTVHHKHEETITVLDPKAKHDANEKTKLPQTDEHHSQTKADTHLHRQKREHKPEPHSASKPVVTPAPPKKNVAPTIPPRKHVTTAAPIKSKPITTPPKKSGPHKRDVAQVAPQTLPAHLPTIETHSNGFVKPQTLPAPLPIDEATPAVIKPQTLPAHLSYPIPLHAATHAAHVDAKRDIPVPLVAKHQHADESPKENEQQHKNEKNEDVQVEDLHEHVPEKSQHKQEETNADKSTSLEDQDHPVIRHHPVPVAELFARPKQSVN